MVAAVGQPHQFYKLLTLLVRPDNLHNLAPHSMHTAVPAPLFVHFLWCWLSVTFCVHAWVLVCVQESVHAAVGRSAAGAFLAAA
jgi:hypothetical protein